MEEKKQSNVILKVVLGIAATAAAVFGAVTAAMFALLRRNIKKLQGVETENNVVTSVGLGKNDTIIAPETDNAFLSCVAGKMTISWGEKPVKNVNLDLTCILGKVTVIIPDGVRVSLEMDAPNAVENIEEAQLPEDALVVTITGKSLFGMVSILR